MLVVVDTSVILAVVLNEPTKTELVRLTATRPRQRKRINYRCTIHTHAWYTTGMRVSSAPFRM